MQNGLIWVLKFLYKLSALKWNFRKMFACHSRESYFWCHAWWGEQFCPCSIHGTGEPKYKVLSHFMKSYARRGDVASKCVNIIYYQVTFRRTKILFHFQLVQGSFYSATRTINVVIHKILLSMLSGQCKFYLSCRINWEWCLTVSSDEIIVLVVMHNWVVAYYVK